MISHKKLANGLTVIVEEMSHVSSVAYDLLVPGGIVSDNNETVGTSLIMTELFSRGAGGMSSRELTEAFDELGARHGESAGLDKFAFSGSLLAENLEPALNLLALMIQKPTFPESEIDPIRSLLLQDVASLYDNPARRVMVELSERYYPAPYNRSTLGSAEGLKKVGLSQIKSLYEQQIKPEKAILSIAGNVKASNVFGCVERLFAEWKGNSNPKPKFEKVDPTIRHHIHQDAAQLQIALTMPSVRFGDDLYYPAKVLLGVLSGGMFGRLFTEVREKRGLCYSVFARHSASLDYGTVLAYAGTTPERSHETLSVMVEVMRTVKDTVTAEELARAKANIKAAIVMSEESSGSRAASNAVDWWLLSRIRDLSEIQTAIDKVTSADLYAVLEAFPVDNFALVTLGSRDLATTFK